MAVVAQTPLLFWCRPAFSFIIMYCCTLHHAKAAIAVFVFHDCGDHRSRRAFGLRVFFRVLESSRMQFVFVFLRSIWVESKILGLFSVQAVVELVAWALVQK